MDDTFRFSNHCTKEFCIIVKHCIPYSALPTTQQHHFPNPLYTCMQDANEDMPPFEAGPNSTPPPLPGMNASATVSSAIYESLEEHQNGVSGLQLDPEYGFPVADPQSSSDDPYEPLDSHKSHDGSKAASPYDDPNDLKL